MKNLNKLVTIEIALKSLSVILKSKSLKATFWTNEAAISGAEALIDLKSIKKKARLRIDILKKQKKQLLLTLSKKEQAVIKSHLKNDPLVQQTYQLS